MSAQSTTLCSTIFSGIQPTTTAPLTHTCIYYIRTNVPLSPVAIIAADRKPKFTAIETTIILSKCAALLSPHNPTIGHAFLSTELSAIRGAYPAANGSTLHGSYWAAFDATHV